MKRAIVIIIILFAGTGAIAYPYISDFFARKNGSVTIREYETEVATYDEEALNAMWAEAEEYNESLVGQPVHDPFIENTGMAMPDDYGRILNVGGVMGSVEIPKIGVDLPIYHGTSESVLEKGAGHLEGSTLPVGGISRHSVLTGHSGLTHAKLFTDLTELEQGDLFFVHVLGKTLAYEVGQIKVVEPHVTDDLIRFPGKDYCTLLTCTPYGINTHRLLVRGERVEYVPEMQGAIVPARESNVNDMIFHAVVITSAIMLLVVIIALVRTKRRHE